jgi:hypothetical protein
VVTLVDCARARARFVSFCSNHDSGTALPPPSVGGLRRRGPVTCGFAVQRPALSRRPRAVGAGNHPVPLDGRELAQRRAAATCRSRGCSVRARSHLLLPAAPACAGRRRPGSHPAEPSAFAPPHLSRCRFRRSAFVRRGPPVVLWPPSSPSSPPMRCPGSGLQRFRRLSASKPLRPPWRLRGTTASPHPAGGGNPASAATATCWHTKCRDVGHLYPYKGARGARIVSARRGELMRSFRRAQVRGTVSLE